MRIAILDGAKGCVTVDGMAEGITDVCYSVGIERQLSEERYRCAASVGRSIL